MVLVLGMMLLVMCWEKVWRKSGLEIHVSYQSAVSQSVRRMYITPLAI
jgi:hypothetical protein